MVLKLSSVAFDFIISMAESVYPNEFAGLLREKDGVITEVLLLPRTVYGRTFASLDFTMLPAFTNYCGSVHSHPSPNARPSRGDLAFFGKTGDVHIITAYPYTKQSTRAFNAVGEEIGLEIVD